MAQTADYFSDLLQAGEYVSASIGGPGPAHHRVLGDERTWWQLAFTAGAVHRLLVVRLVASGGGSYKPSHRFALPKVNVRVNRFPRTPTSTARLEVHGGNEPIIIEGIDDPTIYPSVEPFLAAYGGPVGGAGTVKVADPDPYDLDPQADTKKLLVVAGAGLALVILCCGCSGLVTVLRALLA